MNKFWGMKIFGDILGIITKIGLYLRSFLCILGSFLELGIFLGVAKIQIFFLVLEIPDIFLG